MCDLQITVSWSEWEPWTSRPEPGCKGRTRKCTTEEGVDVGKDNCCGESCSRDPGNILFIIGGREETEEDTNKIYSFSLDPSVDVPSCQQPDTTFPIALNYPSTAIFPEPCAESGYPTVCGGGSWIQGQWPWGVTTFKDCYKLNLDATPFPRWINVGSKNYETYATGVFKPQHLKGLMILINLNYLLRLILSTWLGSSRNWWMESTFGITRCC